MTSSYLLPPSLHPSCSGVKCSQQLLVLLAAACLFFYVGAETGFGGYIASFVSSHRTRMSGILPPTFVTLAIYQVVTNTELGMTLADGQLMTSVFWGFLALGRLVAVPIAVKFSPLQVHTHPPTSGLPRSLPFAESSCLVVCRC